MNPSCILWLTEYYYPNRGGMATSCDRIVAGLRAEGLQVDVCHFTDRHRHLTRRSESGGMYLAVNPVEDLPHTLNLAWRLVEGEAKGRKYTHVVAFGGNLAMAAGPVYAAWLGLPFVLCLRGNDWDTGIFSPKRMQVLERAVERAAVVCCVSREKVDRVRALWPEKEVAFTPNGIDLASWKPLPSQVEMARQWRESRVAGGKKVLGLFGALKAKKGIGMVLDALDLPSLRKKVMLLLVGEMEAEAEERVRGMGLDVERVPFLDRYELLGWYPACDGIALPSWYDGMPNVLLEAMALGIPVLGSSVDGIRDVVEEVSPDFLFPPGNVAACRKAIRLWLEQDHDARAELSLRLMDHVGTHFTPVLEAKNYLEVFDRSRKPLPFRANSNN